MLAPQPPFASQGQSQPGVSDARNASTSTSTSSSAMSNGRTRSGRAGPRSRTGCAMCKQRRVRCDEARPFCGHCTRLALDCYYPPWPRRKAQARSEQETAGRPRGASSVAQDQTAVYPSNGNGLDDVDDGVSSNIVLPQGSVGVQNGGAGPASSFGQSQRMGSQLNDLSISDPIQCDDNAILEGSHSSTGDRRSTRFSPNDVFATSWPDTRMSFSWGEESLYDAPNGTFDAPDAENTFRTFTFSDTPRRSSWADGQMLVPTTARTMENRQLNERIWSMGMPAASPARPSPKAQPLPPAGVRTSGRDRLSVHSESISFNAGSNYMHSDRSKSLLSYFEKIVQPPASLLIIPVHKWRRLQDYFVRTSEQHRAVASALFSLIELLATDDIPPPEVNGEGSGSPALALRDAAQREIAFELSKHQEIGQKIRDLMLVAIFLLAWFEVIRDQVADQSLFPSELADRIISSDDAWNPYSKQLLQWFNTLDSKATHLGGQHLLSPKTLQIVSQHRPQISTSDDSDDDDHSVDESLGDAVSSGVTQNHNSTRSPGHVSHHRHHDSPTEGTSPGTAGLNLRQMKQTVLNTVLQPALDWYLMGQSYCRRIGSHDRHHRNRSTVKDEYEVITACKQLESDLFRLWRQRPTIIKLTASQLAQVVCADVAERLEDIFSIYCASFWILFVYLHRVSWWSLPHSETTQGALEQVWKNMQRSYGEVVDGGEKKVVHPALLWPLFLFGSECTVEDRRTWAVDQLESLGVAKQIVGDDEGDDALPPFRLSAGATRNAKRAALLLRELIKRQDQCKARVDEKNLSIELFGCHFSII